MLQAVLRSRVANMSCRVLLADDETIGRQGLRSMFSAVEGFEVVGEAANGEEAVMLTQELSPDVVVMDLKMPRLNGIEATQRIAQQQSKARIVMLTANPSGRELAPAFAAGVSGYLLKGCDFDELVQAIETVMGGRNYISPSITHDFITQYLGKTSVSDSSLARLTARERDVLQRLSDGRSAKEIAAEFKVSTKTIEGTRREIMRKLDVHSLAALTKLAIREGLTSLDT